MRRCLIPCAVVVGLLWLTSLAQSANPVPENTSLTSGTIAFTKNMGQWPDSILFRASAGGTVMWFTHDGIYYQFIKHIKKDATGEEALAAGLGPRRPEVRAKFDQTPDSIETALVKASFVGASKAEVIGSEEQAYKCNYFIGNDPTKWQTDVPNYSVVTFKNIYPGVEATFRGEQGRLTYELHGTTEALEHVTVGYGEASIQQTSEIVAVQTKLGEKSFHGMVPAGTEQQPTATYSASSGIIYLVYSTYLGGNDLDGAHGVAVDASGCAYVTGVTNSTDFPTQSPFQTDPGEAAYDAFVTKLSADGSGLVYSTYLGGNDNDESYGVAIDGSGNAYVTGRTFSTDFPTQSPYQAYQGPSGLYDVFVTKLSPSGNSLVYSTYLGGGDDMDQGCGIAVDDSGSAYVTGFTFSIDFPTQAPFQSKRGVCDAFVTKLSPTGTSLAYSIYLGGGDHDEGYAIVTDSSGSAYVTGWTSSVDFPIQSPYQTDQPGSDAFITKLSVDGTSLIYSTYVGGNEPDRGYGIAVDGLGCAYVTGLTQSTDFPTQSPYQTYQGPAGYGYCDVFVTKLSAAGNSLVYSTYLGGNDYDWGFGIAVDSSGSAYVSGGTRSTNFPTQSPYQTNQPEEDVFVTKLSPAGDTLVYSTYLGGDMDDQGDAIAVDDSGNAYVTGWSVSTNFPTEPPIQLSQIDGNAFVTKLALLTCCTGTTGNVNTVGIVDLADLSLLIAYLTTTPKPTLPCPPSANVNATGIVDLSDLSLLIAYLTVTPIPALPNCP